MSERESTGFHPTLPEDLKALKKDDTFLVEGPTGSYRQESPEGVYHRNCRMIASSHLMLDGKPLVYLGDSVRPERQEHRCDYTNPDGWLLGDLPVSQGVVLVSRTKILGAGTLNEDLRVRNYGSRPLRLELCLANQPDFKDIFEVRNWLAPLSREITRSPGKGRFGWRYEGLDQESRSVKLSVSGGAAVDRDGAVVWNLDLDPHSTARLRATYSFSCGGEDKKAVSKEWHVASEVRAGNARVQTWLHRSREDLKLLATSTRFGPFPYAGVPWFSAMFGRDALITAIETLWLWPELGATVLQVLAAKQATEHDAGREAQPGKILHEARFSERTNLGHLPFDRYYGAVDSAPLFMMLAAAYYRRTGDRSVMRKIRPALENAMAWMEGEGAPCGDGLLRYDSHNELGLTHQGWRDAEDAIFHPDGRKAKAPIALVEAQAYLVAALRGWSELLRTMFGDPENALLYAEKAEEASKELRRLFWDRQERFFSPALDGASRPTRFLCSSAGHVLWAGAASQADAYYVSQKLFWTDFWSGWGVRTVPKGQPYYNPLSYHNGAVWPHDTMIAAIGAARYGDREPALRVFESLLEVAAGDSMYRLPELFSGLTRYEGDPRPLRFATACSPQAWACAVPFGLLQALLGLEFSALEGRITLRRPCLPEMLPSLSLKGLSFGGGTVDLEIRREGGSVAVISARKPDGVSIEVLI